MIGSRIHVPLDIVHDSIGPDTLASNRHGIATLPTDATIVPLAAVFTDWIVNFFKVIHRQLSHDQFGRCDVSFHGRSELLIQQPFMKLS